MYNKVFKNYQVNLGMPFQVRMPVNIKHLDKNSMQDQEVSEEDEQVCGFSEADPSIEREDILHKAQEEADLIIKEAQIEAERIIENAQKDAEELEKTSADEGKKQGYEQGYNEAMSQYEDLIKQAQEMKENTIVEYNHVLAGIENEAVELILGIAKKVIGEEININKENILMLVKQGFEKCSSKENAVIRVSPDDFDYLTENKDKLVEMIGGAAEIEIKKEASLSAGACLIETPFGSVDAGVQTKLKKIEEAFKQIVDNKRGNF